LCEQARANTQQRALIGLRERIALLQLPRLLGMLNLVLDEIFWPGHQ
jgi:hypothetical protein